MCNSVVCGAPSECVCVYCIRPPFPKQREFFLQHLFHKAHKVINTPEVHRRQRIIFLPFHKYHAPGISNAMFPLNCAIIFSIAKKNKYLIFTCPSQAYQKSLSYLSHGEKIFIKKTKKKDSILDDFCGRTCELL